ncbi:putative disease resistance RPP13-like protein 1 [Morella rubra]|uniref:Putative disease resistance RPP13-like protein 1 n=1 Tax=Morella rubra TaxID=262757 RepID=A0A6A1V5H8_9ROSI|nr:putative disease resistance RPP13-like protein 1 [Morella rubra]
MEAGRMIETGLTDQIENRGRKKRKGEGIRMGEGVQDAEGDRLPSEEKGSCSRVKKLGTLSHLRGTLCISRLENVIESEDGSDANLIGKSNLNTLQLKWSSNIGESQDKTKAFEVLNNLQPHNSLKELTIRHYEGERFPTWLRGASFSNMVLLTIGNYTECTLLPPIGELPSLQVLWIEGFDKVKNIGLELFREGCSQPFKSLRTLHFENMLEWENWSHGQEFQGLLELSIKRYPKLSGELPIQLPLLKKVVIENCAQLVVSIIGFSKLCEVAIKECKGLVCRNDVGFQSLGSLELREISESAGHIEELTHVED